MTGLQERATLWLQKLIRIPSVNPDHAGPRAGPPGEAAIAAALGEWLGELGASWVEVLETPDTVGRPNVYAGFEGTSERWIAQDTHLDTVAVEHMTQDPFSGDLRDGRVWGRGAVDTKGALAAMLAVLEAMRDEGRRPAANLLVVGTASEESSGLLGARAFQDWVRAKELSIDELLISEPTECAPVYGHKGGLGLLFTVIGRAGHSSRPDQAQNAIYGAAELVKRLEVEHFRLQGLPARTAVGAGTLAVTTVSGGNSRNTIPDRCQLYAGRRLVPGEDPDTVARDLVASVTADLPVEVEITHRWPAVHQPPDSFLSRRLASFSGHDPDVSTLGTNGSAYSGVAKEMAVFGPGAVEQAHAAEEWCTVKQLGLAAHVLDQWIQDEPPP